MKTINNTLFLLLIMSVQNLIGQNVGIGNTDPKAKLDVSGDFILMSADLSLGDGNTINLDVLSNKFNHYKLIGPTSNFQIGGIQAAENDRIISLYNRTGHSLEIYNDDITASTTNRILTGTGGTFAVYSGGSVSLKYDNIIGRWEVIASHYNSLDNFGSGNWTLSGDDIYNANVGNVGINAPNPLTSLQVNGNLSLLSDTVLTPCSTIIPPSNNNRIIIDNNVKKKSVFHILKDTECAFSLSPFILGIQGGTDGQIVTIILHVDNAQVLHLAGIPTIPSSSDSMSMIELYEPNNNGNINQPNQINFNKGGAITLIYDGFRNRWKPITYYGDIKSDLASWLKSPNLNDIYNPNSGNVGIGTGLPTEKLDVNGNLNISGIIKTNGASGGAGTVLTNNGNGAMSWSSQSGWPVSGNDIKNPNTGSVGIGSFPSLGIKLDVNGNARFTGNNISGITDKGCILAETSGANIRQIAIDGQRIQSSGGLNVNPYNPIAREIYLNPLGGNIGINTTTNITSPLSFPNVFGKKISLWSNGSNNEYGLGIQSGEMQIYTAGQDIISFGYGSSNAYTRTMAYYPGTAQLGINSLPLPGYHLSVNGSIKTKEVVVETANWPDYVFTKDYKLPSLNDLENYIQIHGHLPNISSAKEIEVRGQFLGETQKKMMEKLEELTLYIIQLSKEIELLKNNQNK